MVDVGAIRQEYIGQSALVLIVAVGLERDFLSKDQCRRSLFGSLAVGLAILRAVDAMEADAFRSPTMQDLDSIVSRA